MAVVGVVDSLRMSCLCPPDIPRYRADRSSRQRRHDSLSGAYFCVGTTRRNIYRGTINERCVVIQTIRSRKRDRVIKRGRNGRNGGHVKNKVWRFRLFDWRDERCHQWPTPSGYLYWCRRFATRMNKSMIRATRPSRCKARLQTEIYRGATNIIIRALTIDLSDILFFFFQISPALFYKDP